MPCCPGGRFCERCIKAMQFNVLFIDKVEGGAVGKVGGWGGKGAAQALLAA